LHYEARQRSGDPNKGDFGLREAEFEEVWCAVSHFETPDKSVVELAHCVSLSCRSSRHFILYPYPRYREQGHTRRIARPVNTRCPSP
jgi:hypothetical protein